MTTTATLAAAFPFDDLLAATDFETLTREKPDIGRARELLANIVQEDYRFYSTADGEMIRPAGAFPKRYPSEYARDDARELQDILMQSHDVHSLVVAADHLGFSLHLLYITPEGRAVFAKEKPGLMFEAAEQVSALL